MVSESDADQSWNDAGLLDFDVMLNYMPDSQPATDARTVFFTSLWQCYWVTCIETDLYHAQWVQPVLVSPLTAIHYLAHRFVAVMSTVCSRLQTGYSFMKTLPTLSTSLPGPNGDCKAGSSDVHPGRNTSRFPGARTLLGMMCLHRVAFDRYLPG
jgi:hypothetical protein